MWLRARFLASLGMTKDVGHPERSEGSSPSATSPVLRGTHQPRIPPLARFLTESILSEAEGLVTT